MKIILTNTLSVKSEPGCASGKIRVVELGRGCVAGGAAADGTGCRDQPVIASEAAEGEPAPTGCLEEVQGGGEEAAVLETLNAVSSDVVG